MANEQNLISLNDLPPDKRREISVKGGKTPSIAKDLSRRKYCMKECPLWNNCPYKGASLTESNKIKYHNSYRYPCMMKKVPVSHQDRVMRLLTGGRKGVEQELQLINTVLAEVVLYGEGQKTPENVERLGRSIARAAEFIYGKTTNVSADVKSVGVLCYDDLALAGVVRDVTPEEKVDSSEEVAEK